MCIGAYILHVASVPDDHGDTWETATRIDLDRRRTVIWGRWRTWTSFAWKSPHQEAAS